MPSLPIRDFSQEAIQKAVRREGLTHWLTLYPPALGLLGGLAGALFGLPVLYFVAAGGITIGGGSLIINLFLRGDKIASRYISQLNKIMRKKQAAIMETLEESLRECCDFGDTGKIAQRALMQFSLIESRREEMKKLLSGKLEESEMTYARFVGAIEGACLSVLGNLSVLASVLKSENGIDENYALKQLVILKRDKDGKTNVNIQRQIQALEESLRLAKSERDDAEGLLTKNEEAITALERLSAEIARLRTGEFATADYESAIMEIQDLAKRAKNYGVQ
jgi:hypothetical protein